MQEAQSESPAVMRFFTRLGMITFYVVLVLVIVEAGLRTLDWAVEGVPFFERKGELFYKPHPYLFRVPRSNLSLKGQTTNAHGFRGRPFDMPKPGGTFRILALGGSAVWNPYVKTTEDTWAAKLEDKLNASMKAEGRPLRIEVINGGVPGYTSAESLLNFVFRGQQIQPDAVVVYQGYNDYKPNRFPGFVPDYSHWRGKDHSAMRQLARVNRIIWYISRGRTLLMAELTERFDTVAPEGIAAFAHNIERIAVLARHAGAQPIFATYGASVTNENVKSEPNRFLRLKRSLWRLTIPVGFQDAHVKYNDAVRDLGRRIDVPVVPVAEGVPPDFDHYADHVHFTAQGTDVVADIMHKHLLQHLKLPGRNDGASDSSVEQSDAAPDQKATESQAGDTTP